MEGKKYTLVSNFDPNESYELEAETLEEAYEEALEQLGYFICSAGVEEDDEE